MLKRITDQKYWAIIGGITIIVLVLFYPVVFEKKTFDIFIALGCLHEMDKKTIKR